MNYSGTYNREINVNIENNLPAPVGVDSNDVHFEVDWTGLNFPPNFFLTEDKLLEISASYADKEYVNDALSLKMTPEEVDAAMSVKATKEYVDQNQIDALNVPSLTVKPQLNNNFQIIDDMNNSTVLTVNSLGESVWTGQTPSSIISNSMLVDDLNRRDHKFYMERFDSDGRQYPQGIYSPLETDSVFKNLNLAGSPVDSQRIGNGITVSANGACVTNTSDYTRAVVVSIYAHQWSNNSCQVLLIHGRHLTLKDPVPESGSMFVAPDQLTIKNTLAQIHHFTKGSIGLPRLSIKQGNVLAPGESLMIYVYFPESEGSVGSGSRQDLKTCVSFYEV